MFFSFPIMAAMALSIFLPGILAIFKFRAIQNRHRPFIYLIWMGCINQVISIYCAFRFHNNIANNIIYNFTQSLFLLWFFKGLGNFQGRKHFLNFLIFLFVGVWVTEGCIAGPFGSHYTSSFDTIYAFCVVMFSVDVMNRILVSETNIIKNPTFIICMTFVLFFSLQIMEGMFRLCGLKNSEGFSSRVQDVTLVINFLSNFIFALSVLWMQKKRAFTLQF